MPAPNPKLAANVRVSVNKRFIKDRPVLSLLQSKYDWSTTGLCFPGRTVSCRQSGPTKSIYGVILDEVPDVTMELSGGCLKYVGPVAEDDEFEDASDNHSEYVEDASDVDLLENAEDSSDDELDLTRDVPEEHDDEGWTWQDTLVDSRLLNDSFRSMKARFLMPNHQHAPPLEYFLFFLPQDFFTRILENTNAHARASVDGWRDITFEEYLMWIALLSVMVVVGHVDKKAYWKAGTSYFLLSIDFSDYMSVRRFDEITRMQCFEMPSLARQREDPLYQIRDLLAALNEHLVGCLEPCKYLVVDESMNQWLGIGMPNVKKVPRKPHPIGQEFKSIADYHTNCILQLDTQCDDFPKEFDDLYGARSNLGTVKRLVKPWFFSGRTVTADSWFGSLNVVDMLMSVGLFAIMMVVKRRAWPRGLPRQPTITENLGTAYGSHCSAFKITENGHRVMAVSYRDKKTKTLVATCGTTAMTGRRAFYEDGRRVEIQRPAVFSEYEEHKSSVDTANNRRDNLRSYHDALATERWEMRFLAFVFGIAEANAWSCYKEFAVGGDKITHGKFKDTLAYQLLNYCKSQTTRDANQETTTNGIMPRRTDHTLVSLKSRSNKVTRMSCRTCHEKGKRGPRFRTVHCCSCNPDRPLCRQCHVDHAVHIALQREAH